MDDVIDHDVALNAVQCEIAVVPVPIHVVDQPRAHVSVAVSPGVARATPPMMTAMCSGGD